MCCSLCAYTYTCIHSSHNSFCWVYCSPFPNIQQKQQQQQCNRLLLMAQYGTTCTIHKTHVFYVRKSCVLLHLYIRAQYIMCVRIWIHTNGKYWKNQYQFCCLPCIYFVYSTYYFFHVSRVHIGKIEVQLKWKIFVQSHFSYYYYYCYLDRNTFSWLMFWVD